MMIIRLFSLGISLFVVSWTAADSPNAESYDPGRFEKSVVAPNLIQPMEMAIAPDGRIYLIEIAGLLKVIDPTTNTVETIGKVKVTTEQENGLIGLALDPQFETNHWLYLQYSPPDYIGQHISRFTIRDGKLDMESESLVMKFEEQRQECCHHAGSMEFGIDGCLYIGTGDNTNPFGDSQGFAPIDERDTRSAFNAQRTAANTKSYNGKVLRIKPLPQGGYEVPDGNLFPRDGSIGLPEIYVMGCRNPWRINIDRKTGYLYWGDVGPDAGGDGPRGPRGYDEVNQARKAGNFGWPHFIANNRPYPRVAFDSGEVGELFDAAKPLNKSAFNKGAIELPPAQPAWIFYPSAASPEFPELGTGGRTACAGPSYDYDPNLKSDTKFPEHFDRSVFIFEWSRNWIAAVHLDAQSNINQIEPFLPEMTFTRPIDLQFDRKGSLYVIEYGETWGVNQDARLVRLDYRRGNRNPTARVKASVLAGREPLTVEFNSDGTKDKDGDELKYAWRRVLSGTSLSDASVFNTQPNASIAFDAPGIYNVELRVDDGHGGSDAASVSIVVGNAVPELRFAYPHDGDFFDPGKAVEYRVVVSDEEDGTSDEQEADAGSREFIDANAPSRVSVQSAIVSSSKNANEDTATMAPGLKLIKGSDCFNCHAIDRPLVGPAFVDVANKYRDQPNALDASVERVTKGSSGVWGKVPMLPHSQHTAQEIREMVSWVFATRPDPGSQMLPGFVNQMTIQSDKKVNGKLKLLASYQDLGRDTIPPLTGTASIFLRQRTIQAEQADEIKGMSVLGTHNAEDGKFMGAIEHASFLRFNDINMPQVRSIAVRVTSAGVGGDIVVHADRLDGPVLGTTHVDVNGSWDGWYEKKIELVPYPNRTNIYLEFINEKNRGGLMNIDSVRFDG